VSRIHSQSSLSSISSISFLTFLSLRISNIFQYIMSTPQNDPLLTPRKRSADELTDPDNFLALYFEERGINGDLTSKITRSIDRRAEQARERFKRIRTATTSALTGSPGVPGPSTDIKNEILTPEQKYTRRLVNNRKSSAASRVHREVLKAERAFALNQLVQQTNEYEKKVVELTQKLASTEEKVEQLQALNMGLQGQPQPQQSQEIMPIPLPVQRTLNKPPRVSRGGSRRPSSGLSPLNTNLISSASASASAPPVSVPDPQTAPAGIWTIPMTPKSAVRSLTSAFKLEENLDKPLLPSPSSLEPSAHFAQEFDASKCAEISPNSRRNEDFFINTISAQVL